MNKQCVETWLNKLKKYWLDKDIKNATLLFKNTTFYQETPFMKPYTTYEEIFGEWQHITKDDIKNIEFNILAINGYIAIVEWFLEQNNDVLDGIYEIKFNKNLEYIYFKSWEMEKKI